MDITQKLMRHVLGVSKEDNDVVLNIDIDNNNSGGEPATVEPVAVAGLDGTDPAPNPMDVTPEATDPLSAATGDGSELGTGEPAIDELTIGGEPNSIDADLGGGANPTEDPAVAGELSPDADLTGVDSGLNTETPDQSNTATDGDNADGTGVSGEGGTEPEANPFEENADKPTEGEGSSEETPASDDAAPEDGEGEANANKEDSDNGEAGTDEDSKVAEDTGSTNDENKASDETEPTPEEDDTPEDIPEDLELGIAEDEEELAKEEAKADEVEDDVKSLESLMVTVESFRAAGGITKGAAKIIYAGLDNITRKYNSNASECGVPTLESYNPNKPYRPEDPDSFQATLEGKLGDLVDNFWKNLVAIFDKIVAVVGSLVDGIITRIRGAGGRAKVVKSQLEEAKKSPSKNKAPATLTEVAQGNALLIEYKDKVNELVTTNNSAVSAPEIVEISKAIANNVREVATQDKLMSYGRLISNSRYMLNDKADFIKSISNLRDMIAMIFDKQNGAYERATNAQLQAMETAAKVEENQSGISGPTTSKLAKGAKDIIDYCEGYNQEFNIPMNVNIEKIDSVFRKANFDVRGKDSDPARAATEMLRALGGYLPEPNAFDATLSKPVEQLPDLNELEQAHRIATDILDLGTKYKSTWEARKRAAKEIKAFASKQISDRNQYDVSAKAARDGGQLALTLWRTVSRLESNALKWTWFGVSILGYVSDNLTLRFDESTALYNEANESAYKAGVAATEEAIRRS